MSATHANVLHTPTVALSKSSDAVVIIDQTKLPAELVTKELRTKEELFQAIYRLEVRGAPAIGVCAALGLYVLARNMPTSSFDSFYGELKKTADYINSSRPTAVNLSWALERMTQKAQQSKSLPVLKIVDTLKEEATAIMEEDTRMCRKIGEHALLLLNPGMGLLTHCNAGQLATSKYGTATSVMYLGQENGYGFKVYCDETRPLLQGARLTAYELMAAGIDTTLICDNMAALLMKQGKIDAVFVGCDRVAANGDAANKIGTSYVAIAAKYYGIPFYVCAPSSTLDMACPTGDDIIIEQRPAEEVTEMWYEKRMAPDGVKVFNPSFDVTESANITAIITEHGVAYPPYTDSLAKIMNLSR
ncbi:MAG: S-methyl-5-thioribose-1-phosphate isomerase [Christensenellaceae bacterium]